MVKPLSAASLGSKLRIYWWLLTSSGWLFLLYFRFASRQAVANEKSPHSRVSRMYDSVMDSCDMEMEFASRPR